MSDFATIKADIPTLINDIREGRAIVLVDDEDRENEGDLIVAAQMATPSMIAMMAQQACGLVCLALTEQQASQLGLATLTPRHPSSLGTAFTESIEGRHPTITTGISADDRAQTIALAIAREATPDSITTPGHVFPLVARPGGTLKRAGHTEASVDLARMAGLSPAAVICEIMKPDGSMARRDDLVDFVARFDLNIGTIADLIAWRLQHDPLVTFVGQRTITLDAGTFEAHVFTDTIEGAEHYAFVRSPPETPPSSSASASAPAALSSLMPWVHIHQVDMITDVLNSGGELQAALRAVAGHYGAVVLLNGRREMPILEAIPAEARPGAQKQRQRAYGIGAQILRHVGITEAELLTHTDSSDKSAGASSGQGAMAALEALGMRIAATRSLS
ncbi:MAG: 3,4-dihydroxy-2-butanone-4-phosphate synthase [Alphaproteobacteria bacterium]|nr:3,4-dihydroxy-2-butanone-4-phosphate synthase [Alphaproteobacteria bacterium]